MITLNRDEIEALIDQSKAFTAIEDCFRAVSLGKVNLPPVGHITFPDHAADCHIKYGHIEGEPMFAIKVATGFPKNSETGLPNNNGVILVLSAVSGEMKAILHDEMVMTDIRTGIAGAIASKLLANNYSQKILIAGTGIQAQRQIEAHAAKFGPDVVFQIWGRSVEKAAVIVEQLSSLVNVNLAEDLGTACQTADIIVTTTSANSPVIKNDWISKGTHITAVGADASGKQELESALIERADVLVADLSTQCLDHGEFATPYTAGLIETGNVKDIGSVLIAAEHGRKTPDDITIADLTGLAAQDITMASHVLLAHQTTTDGASQI